jgi:hypothetical protein
MNPVAAIVMVCAVLALVAAVGLFGASNGR